MNPPKISSTVMLWTQVRTERRLSGFSGNGTSRTFSSAARAASTFGCTPRNTSTSAEVWSSRGSRPYSAAVRRTMRPSSRR